MKYRIIKSLAFLLVLCCAGYIATARAQFTPNGQYYVFSAPIAGTSPVGVMSPGIYSMWQVCAPSTQQYNCFFYTGAVPSAAPSITWPVGGTYALCKTDSQVQTVKQLPQAGVACAQPSATSTATVSSVARGG